MENVRLVKESRSRAGALGFDMRYGWVPAIAVLIGIYAVVAFFFD